MFNELLEVIDLIVMGGVPVVGIAFLLISFKSKPLNAFTLKDSFINFSLITFMTATMMLNGFITYGVALFWFDASELTTYPDYVPSVSFILLHFFLLMIFFMVAYVLKHFQETQLIPGEGSTYVRMKSIIKQKLQKNM